MALPLGSTKRLWVRWKTGKRPVSLRGGVSPEAIHLFLADQEIAYPCGAQVAAFGGSQ